MNYELRINQLSIINYQLSIINYQLSIINFSMVKDKCFLEMVTKGKDKY